MARLHEQRRCRGNRQLGAAAGKSALQSRSDPQLGTVANRQLRRFRPLDGAASLHVAEYNCTTFYDGTMKEEEQICNEKRWREE